jgi:type IV fimbrial biogenesis protein FimT
MLVELKNNRIKPFTGRGFTLIEAMVTVTILGVMIAIAVPTYTDIVAKRRVLRAAEAILSDLRWARSECFKRDVNMRVTFTIGESWSYSVNADPKGTDTQIKTISVDSFPGTTMTSANFRGGVTYTTFDAVRGVNKNNGTIVLNADNRSASITVSTLGRVRICDAPGYPDC